MNGAGKWNRPLNSSPLAQNDTVFSEGNKLTIDVLNNDTDPDGDPLRISRITNSPAGDYVVEPNRIVYHPSGKNPETDTIEYEIIDFQGGLARAKVVIYPKDSWRKPAINNTDNNPYV